MPYIPEDDYARQVLGDKLETPRLRLVDVLTGEDYFGLTTATPLQRAICEWSEGRKATPRITAAGYAEDEQERMRVEWILGKQPKKVPAEVYLLAGIRSGKSLLAAAVAWKASQTVDVSSLRPGEKARVSVLSVRLDQADAVLMHLRGVLNRPGIAPTVIRGDHSDGVDFRHPSGTLVEVRVVAGRRAGGSLVAYWSGGVVFDEAPRMQGEADGVVNFEDARKSVLGRLLPGAQLWAIGSPWAPIGPVFNAVEKHHGKPGSVLVIRAPAPALNPAEWTPRKCSALREKEPDSHRMDVLGEWGRPESSPIHEGLLDPCLREPGDVPYDPLHHYEAAMDPAGRTNAWTLAIGTMDADGTRHIVALREWRPGTEGVSPLTVLEQVRLVCGEYGVRQVITDQWAADPIKDLGRIAGIDVESESATARSNNDMYAGLIELLKARRISIPRDKQAVEDLYRLRRKLTAGGGIAWVLPLTADGRHCDYAPVIGRLATCPMRPPDKEDEAKLGMREREELYLQERLQGSSSKDEDEFDFDPEPFWGSDDLVEQLTAEEDTW